MSGGTPREALFLFAAAGDWARVAPAAREALASDPEDAPTLALLSIALTHLEQPAAAVEAGRQAVGVDPELGLAHYALGHAFLAHDDVPSAERAARETLRIEPDSDAYSLLGQVFARRRRWHDALDAAEQGLEIDPEHAGCANVRVLALGALGRGEEAERVADETLAADPDNAGTHANRGWLLLRQAKYDEALESFREALRLDPTFDSARLGILEALKARSGVYRLILRYGLWMNTLDARARWFVLLGLFFGARIARATLRENPALWPLLGPALGAYFLFAMSTWLAAPLSNLFLRLNPFGRLALNRAETTASTLVGLCLATAIVAGVVAAIASSTGWFVLALAAFLLLVPISGAFNRHGTRAWPRLRAAVIVLAALGLAAAVLGFVSFDLAIWPLAALFLGAFTFGWVANYLSIKYS